VRKDATIGAVIAVLEDVRLNEPFAAFRAYLQK
jgi:hypothetical protein